jgi:serine/threonine protein kinase
MNDLVGQTLRNRYHIQALIGRGEMAEVYKAWDARRQYSVAIKVMREDLAEDQEFLQRFKREARALAALSHANIVRFYSFERQGHLAFIVMDYVEGTTLRRRILEAGGKPLPLEEVLSIVRQVCAALNYAHGEGIIHRDVKPGNILIQPDGRVLLSDFGIARAADTATVTSVMPGAPAYMSPEQCRSQSLGARTDIYSLGIVVYEMLAGRRPFIGQSQAAGAVSTNERVRWEQVHLSPPALRQINPQVTYLLETVVLRALAKDPAVRFASGMEFWEAFAAAVGWTRSAKPVNRQDEKAESREGNRDLKSVGQTLLPVLRRSAPQLTLGMVLVCIVVIFGMYLRNGRLGPGPILPGTFAQGATAVLETSPSELDAGLAVSVEPSPTSVVSFGPEELTTSSPASDVEPSFTAISTETAITPTAIPPEDQIPEDQWCVYTVDHKDAQKPDTIREIIQYFSPKGDSEKLREQVFEATGGSPWNAVWSNWEDGLPIHATLALGFVGSIRDCTEKGGVLRSIPGPLPPDDSIPEDQWCSYVVSADSDEPRTIKTIIQHFSTEGDAVELQDQVFEVTSGRTWKDLWPNGWERELPADARLALAFIKSKKVCEEHGGILELRPITR